MFNEVLRKIRDTIEAVLNGLKPKLTIKTPFFELVLDASALTSLQADQDDFSITIDHCFMRRDVYIAPLDKETIDLVRASATEIRDLLDERVRALSGRGANLGSSRHLLMEWAASAKRLGAVLHRRLETLPGTTWIVDDPESANALTSFRTETLPVIGVLIAHLEDRTRVRAEDSYTRATGLLTARGVVAVADAINAA